MFDRAQNTDNLSRLIPDDFVPVEYRGTDRCLDVVNWNIRYFNHRDKTRVDAIARVMSQINADIFVLEEIYEDSLAPVIEKLATAKAGYYEACYGATGGSQRVAILYDTDWVRPKDEVRELFGPGAVTVRVGGKKKDCFPRLPLWGYFQTLPAEAKGDAFDFQLVGLHLKSQRNGKEAIADEDTRQRRESAEALAQWMQEEGSNLDSDIILLGDWNKGPSSPEWKVFRDMEKAKEVAFEKINDDSDFSHLMYQNRNEVGSRLDLQVISHTAYDNRYGAKMGAKVIRWKTVQELFGDPKLKTEISRLRQLVSDHMPVFSRFYFKTRGRTSK
ncbi:MAG TPA: endonuclease/exonuclease/phosphatase family protein [Geothrix sp.]|nr:endonuclease/exonuclease/phosphatase family protein [Geothrix sp.]